MTALDQGNLGILLQIRAMATEDKDRNVDRIAPAMLDLPEEAMWDIVAFHFNEHTMDLCGQEDWYRYAVRMVVLGMLIRVDAGAAKALLEAHERLLEDDEDC